MCYICYFLSIVNLKLILYPLKSVNRMKQLRRLWKQHIGTGAKASQHTRFRCELNWNIVIFKFRLSSFKAECDENSNWNLLCLLPPINHTASSLLIYIYIEMPAHRARTHTTHKGYKRIGVIIRVDHFIQFRAMDTTCYAVRLL